MLKEEDPKCEYFIHADDVVLVKHGYWEEVQGGVFRCSECHRSAIVGLSDKQILTNICYNCGAIMDGTASP